MKRTVIIACLAITSLGIKAQNVFPTSGNVGIGTTSPAEKLDVRGNLILEKSAHPYLYTGTGNRELNRYLYLLNSPGHRSASGLKVGGVLVSDSYAYANPGKNDLIVKGNIGIGTAKPLQKLDVRGNLILETSAHPYLYTGTGNSELNRYLYLLNSPDHRSASGLKVGGVLVSDSYAYANPGKNDLIVKGNIGVGTANPLQKLDVRGNLILETSSNPHLYTGTGKSELNRYLVLLNSPGLRSASGLKAGGVLVSDSYAYANPGKNDLVVKGSIAVGTTTTGSHKLAVEGSIGAREINVEAGSWSDFVFEKDYKLPSLSEVESHIHEKGHLKDIPSTEEVENEGINLGEMDAKLLQKIEELTLYLIEMNKEIDALKKKNSILEEKLKY